MGWPAVALPLPPPNRKHPERRQPGAAWTSGLAPTVHGLWSSDFKLRIADTSRAEAASALLMCSESHCVVWEHISSALNPGPAREMAEEPVNRGNSPFSRSCSGPCAEPESGHAHHSLGLRDSQIPLEDQSCRQRVGVKKPGQAPVCTQRSKRSDLNQALTLLRVRARPTRAKPTSARAEGSGTMPGGGVVELLNEPLIWPPGPAFWV